jgi:hypothetical protein
MDKNRIAGELVRIARDLVARSDAEKIYYKSLRKRYWKDVYRIFPDFNGDEAEDAADWLIDRIQMDFEEYEDTWDEIQEELYEMIYAGLT